MKRAIAMADAARAEGKTVALANGAFDLLHVGHLRYLQASKALADVLIVAVNADASVKRAKGPTRPVIPEAERLELVQALRCVDYAFIFETDTVEPVLEGVRPTFHCKGTDYTEGSVPEAALSKSLGIQTKIVGDPKDHSTTALAQHLKK